MKVGDYVRTKDGRIFRWSKLCTTDIEDYMEHTRKILYIEDEIKSSPNIIDLIEVGDYVNGYYVDNITDIDTGLSVMCNFDLNKMEWTPLENIDIWYSIVTKEQFESMQYEVGD